MKKIIKIAVPIIMAVAIVLCLGWYLFIYDCDFTRDILLDGAHFFEARGSHKIASHFYDWAYKQTSENEDVAIELAQYHVRNGNYTQAEHALAQAIADGGNENLYIALCKTYMQQDKILDAVNLLNNITNPDMKQKLDAMRPTAPTADVEPGFYSQYISVNLSSEGNTIYATSDGQYPSTAYSPYSEPIALKDGENTVYAVSVSENGLVSPLAIYGYTIGGVIEEVNFADPAMETAIREILQVDESKVLFTNDLWSITAFTVPNGVKSFDDLSHMTFLQELVVNSADSGVITQLSGFSALTELTVANTPVSSDEVKIIGKLPVLENLTLSGCGLSSIEGLENLTALTYLDLSKNTIRDIGPLSELKGLQELYLQNNVLVDLAALANLSSLVTLDVSYNTLTSIDAVSGLTALTDLNASNNTLSGIPSLADLNNLGKLNLSYNTLADVSSLSGNSNLNILNLSNNVLTDISALSSLTSLTEIDFSHNQIAAIPTWPADCSLVTINGSENLITSVDPLSGMQNLNKLFVDYNPELAEINNLADCPRLVQVNAYGTKVKDATSLINLSIVANYDPT